MRLAVTRNLFDTRGAPAFDFGLDLLDGYSSVEWAMLPDDVDELAPSTLRGFDALIVESPTRVTTASLSQSLDLQIVARFGVGYDNIEVDACTRNGTALTITPDGVRRPMAVAAVTLVLAVSQHLLARDRLTRQGRWNERGRFVGVGLERRTIGLVGLGNIGREVAALLAPFGCRLIASDPHVSRQQADEAGVELVPLMKLLGESDFVVIVCALTPDTHHLIDAAALAAMRPAAFLVNVARGAIVDQSALVEALATDKIRGAGLDVFEREPIEPSDSLLALPNVIATGHSLGWTDHCNRDCGLSAIRSVIDAAEGRIPKGLVNREVLSHPKWNGARPGDA